MITSDSKLAVLSMDIEDWYHLDYFNENNCDRSFSYLDGIERYCDILIKHKVTSSFFVLAEIANSIRGTLKDIIANNYEIGSHGYSHIRPINLNEEKFYEEIIKSKKIIENIITQPVEGYRARPPLRSGAYNHLAVDQHDKVVTEGGRRAQNPLDEEIQGAGLLEIDMVRPGLPPR